MKRTAIMKTQPEAAAASRMAAASSSAFAMGFSSRTCLPLASASVAIGRWRLCGSMMSTASNAAPAASASPREVKVAGGVVEPAGLPWTRAAISAAVQSEPSQSDDLRAAYARPSGWARKFPLPHRFPAGWHFLD